MKKLLPIVIMSLLALKGLAKGDTSSLNNIPIDTATGKVSVTRIVYADTMSKKWLYQKAMDWITMTYNNPQKTMNADGEKIMLKGNFMMFNSLSNYLVYTYTLYINFKNGKCRIKLTDINYTIQGETMEAAVKMTKAFKHQKSPRCKKWTNRLETTFADLNDLCNSFSSYIQKAVTTARNTKDDW